MDLFTQINQMVVGAKVKIKYCICIFCFIFCFSASAKTIFIDSPDPPPGFEPIHVNQHLRVSVFFLHQRIGFFYIDLHEGRLKFHSPERILPQLAGIKKKAVMLRLLNQSFSLNIECLSNGAAALPSACEQLNKESAYIIYNPKQETVNLFLAPSYFKKPKLNDTIDFIPNSTASWSYLNKLGATGSFSTDAPLHASQVYPSLPNYYNLYSNNVLAYGNKSIVGNMSQNNGVNNGQHFQIQNLFAQNIIQDKIYSGGYMVNSTSPFFQTQIVAGIGVKTTLETLRNAENITSTPLVLFIPQASQVSIFKNEQLIFSQYLEAGYQKINTTGFPDGGYELLIKIGASNTVQRFFTKGFALPPIQAPQYYVLGGYLTNGMTLNNNDYNYLPTILQIPVLQAGFNRRITQKFALIGDVLLDSQQGLFDFGPTFFMGSSFVKTAALVTTKNNYGFYCMFNTQKNRLNFSLTATKIFYQNKTPDYYFLNNLIDNNSASISYRLSENDLLGVQTNYNRNIDQPGSYSAGTYYQRQIGNYKGIGFFFNASYNQANYIGNSYYMSLSMNFSQGSFAGTESLLWQKQNKNTYNNQLASPVVAQGSTVYSRQNEIGIGHSFNETHSLSSTVSSLAGIYNYTAPYSFVSTYINYNRIQGENNSLGYGGGLETEIALNKNGVRFNGVNRGNSSGIIAQVNASSTQDKSTQFALLDSNNRKVAVLPANKKVFISLPGFTDQNYTLVNLSKSDYHIKNPMQHMTLYPGNIGHFTWSVEKRVIVIGRAVTANRTFPLAHTWLHAAKNGIFTDEEGYFQLELAQNITALTGELGADVCQIHLPRLDAGKDYLYIGDVPCL